MTPDGTIMSAAVTTKGNALEVGQVRPLFGPLNIAGSSFRYDVAPDGQRFLPAAKGSALALKAIGCVLADNLSPQKARILLMLALTMAKDSGALQKYFDN